ncbi:MAG: sensor histidine kinase [Candidatus Delongbacteria bacterium]|nr:sensor histidine kinase [Candidatus Delongbacteria bacterium]
MESGNPKDHKTQLSAETSEFHHLVKNHFQFYLSLLNLQINSLENAESQLVLQSSRNRFRLLALLYDLTYQEHSIDSVNLSDYLTEILSYLCRNLKNPQQNILMRHSIDPVHISIQKGLACGMIVNELISNSFQHAFPDHQSGVIELKCQLKENQIVMVIQDDGRGLPDDVDIEHPGRLGLKLVGLLTRQLGGQLKLTGRCKPLAYQIEFGVN